MSITTFFFTFNTHFFLFPMSSIDQRAEQIDAEREAARMAFRLAEREEKV